MLSPFLLASTGLAGWIDEALTFIDTGPGYVVAVIGTFLIWFAWRALMKL